jgi:hypothetical protein
MPDNLTSNQQPPFAALQRLVSLAARWRNEASRHRVSCRLHEGHGDRGRADRHYQRSLDLEDCAAALEAELRAGSGERAKRPNEPSSATASTAWPERKGNDE